MTTKKQICAYCETRNPIENSHCLSCGAVIESSINFESKAITQDLSEKILEICEKYEEYDWCHSFDTANKKKLEKAIKSFEIPKGEKLLMLYDDTVFGSNKHGFALCREGIYWRNSWDTPTKRTKLMWKKFSERKIELKELAIELGRGDRISVSIWDDENREKITELLLDVQALLKE
ncbi:MAG: hypothetical protein GY755_11865 [Chloroflexi bacterium]|nr:hypothetical protein [Chloroflexota bacterium]